jgi:hypothetical protein
MQDNIIESGIILMAVKVEMRRACMDLNIPGPFCSANFNACVEKVGAGITIIFPGMQYDYFISFLVVQAVCIIKPVFPQVMKKLLFHISTIKELSSKTINIEKKISKSKDYPENKRGGDGERGRGGMIR